MQNAFTPGLIGQPGINPLARAPEQLQIAVKSSQGASVSRRQDDLKRAAQEFESLFVSYLLKVMRDTIEESGLTEGGLGKDIYTEMFDQEIARNISRRSPLGISDILLKNLVQRKEASEPGAAKASPPAVEDNASVPGRPNSVLPQHDVAEPDDQTSEIPDFRLPVQAPISSVFGPRKDPFSRQVRFHKGLDLAAPEGTPVHAALGGEVIFAGYEKGYGNTVVVQHADGLQTRYAHLGTSEVKRGDVVSQEQVLGVVGSTGHSTGPHLHFEVIRYGERIDPNLALAD